MASTPVTPTLVLLACLAALVPACQCRTGLSTDPIDVRVAPPALHFGTTWVGARRTLPVELSNHSRVPTDLAAALPAPFDAPAMTHLPGGATVTLEVGFAPSAAGSFTGVLLIADAGIALEGEGLLPPSCSDSTCARSIFDFDAGGCATTPIHSGEACSTFCVQGVCDQGQCLGTARSCDDGDACTDDACSEQAGCVHTPRVCPGVDACHPGRCSAATGCSSTVADDGTACGPRDCVSNVAMVCINGACVSRPAPEGPCDGTCSVDGWCWEHPLPQGNDLFHAFGFASDDIWAVGGGGVTLHWDGSSWRQRPSPTSEDLHGVWGAARDDVWAVGTHGALLHWDGGAWGVGLSTTTQQLWGVFGSSSSDVWAVGDQTTALHFDGAQWSARGAGLTPYYPLESVWCSGPNDAWAAGQSIVAHWTGASWSATTSPDHDQVIWGTSSTDVWLAGQLSLLERWSGSWQRQTSPAASSWFGLWGTGPGDLWLGGMPASTLGHFDGGVWSTVSAPLQSPWLASFWGATPSDVWAVGFGGTLARWDGRRWSAVLDSAATESLEGVWAAASDDVWAVGSAVQHFDGRRWTESPSPAPLEAVWGSSASDVWAVGEGGLVRHFDGTAWSTVSVPTTQNLTGVWGSSASERWIVGAKTLLHFASGRWTDVAPRAGLLLWNVWGTSSADVWAVGTGAVLHWDGARWTDAAVGGAVYVAVWGSGPNDVWIGGAAWAHFDGTAWAPRAAPIAQRMGNALWGTGPRDVWASLSQGGIARFDGTQWNAVVTGTSNDLVGLSGYGRDIWAVGNRATIVHHRR